MRAYRIYWLDGAGKITSADWLEAEDDDSALSDIRFRKDPRPCELWEGRRLIGRIDSSA